MKSNIIKFMMLGLVVVSLSLVGGPLAFAKEHGGKEHGGTAPSGWSKGKKKGWKGANQPPGWSKAKKKNAAT